MRDPLLDRDFLLKLDNDRNRLITVKLIALDLEENPLEEIIGRVTSGSINIDGSSSVRRTCSLSLIANELNINDYYWGFKSKFQCFIGLENRIDSQYPDTIYFPMGTYIITSFTTSQNLTSYSISIQGKDKMCLLNGDIGGNITAISVDFGQLTEQQKDGSLVKTKLLLKDIIREAVREYAHEPLQNIIVNDLDEAALELMEYRGATPLYLVYDNLIGEITNNTLNENSEYYVHTGTNSAKKVYIYDIDEEYNDPPMYRFDHRINLNFENNQIQPTKFYSTKAAAEKGGNDYYTICKAELGDVVGYRLTDLTYAGDLICNAGESITSMLDKIKTMLGDYEYFYNLEGKFVWQRKPASANVSWNNLIQNEGDVIHGESASYTSAITYSFENHKLLSSVSNNPALNNVKNDYSIFGQKTLSTGTQIPVHLRYAIDKKPIAYRAYDGTLYATQSLPEEQKRIIESIPKSIEEIEEILSQHEKAPLPEGLSDEWWDVWDWGEYYKQLTQEYPQGTMNSYRSTEDGYTQVDLTRYFPLGQKEDFPPGYSYSRGWNAYNNLFLFDTINGKLGFTGHNPGCSHNYEQYFMKNYIKYGEQGYNFHAYIYKPVIPQTVITDALSGKYVNYIREKEIIVDWREIIYQMASDYMKHGTQDANNYERVIDTSNFSQDEIDKGIYYIKVEKYYRAQEYKKNRQYYIKVEDENHKISYNEVDNVNADTNFVRNEYYYKSIEEKYDLAKNYQEKYTEVSLNDNTYIKDTYYQKKDDKWQLCHFKDYDSSITYYKKTPDYYKYVDFNYRLRTYNADWYPEGITGYEQYYTDMMSFWRDLYDPNYVGSFDVAGVTKKLYYKEGSKYYWFKNQYGEPFQEDQVYYTEDLYGNWRAHKNLTKDDFNNYSEYYFLPIQGKDNITSEIGLSDDYIFYGSRIYYTFRTGQYYPEYSGETEIDENGNVTQLKHPFAYWNVDIWTSPEDLTFWFDFLDTEGELSQYSIPRIGDRPKAENNTNIKAIYYRETPNVIFVNTDEQKLSLKATKPGYTFISINNSVDHLFKISSQGQSCNDKLNTLLYQNAVATESISLTSIPIFYLQPNTRIYITDEESHINGEYILTKIGYNLAYNGTMSLSATKAVDRIY